MPEIGWFYVPIIAVLSGNVYRSNRRSLVDLCTVIEPLPCSGVKRRDMGQTTVSEKTIFGY